MCCQFSYRFFYIKSLTLFFQGTRSVGAMRVHVHTKFCFLCVLTFLFHHCNRCHGEGGSHHHGEDHHSADRDLQISEAPYVEATTVSSVSKPSEEDSLVEEQRFYIQQLFRRYGQKDRLDFQGFQSLLFSLGLGEVKVVSVDHGDLGHDHVAHLDLLDLQKGLHSHSASNEGPAHGHKPNHDHPHKPHSQQPHVDHNPTPCSKTTAASSAADTKHYHDHGHNHGHNHEHPKERHSNHEHPEEHVLDQDDHDHNHDHTHDSEQEQTSVDHKDLPPPHPHSNHSDDHHHVHSVQTNLTLKTLEQPTPIPPGPSPDAEPSPAPKRTSRQDRARGQRRKNKNSSPTSPSHHHIHDHDEEHDHSGSHKDKREAPGGLATPNMQMLSGHPGGPLHQHEEVRLESNRSHLKCDDSPTFLFYLHLTGLRSHFVLFFLVFKPHSTPLLLRLESPLAHLPEPVHLPVPGLALPDRQPCLHPTLPSDGGGTEACELRSVPILDLLCLSCKDKRVKT